MEKLKKYKILQSCFYGRGTKIVAKDLLGKILVKKIKDGMLGGMIVETEAYFGADDPASHAANGRTPRSEIMFSIPGLAYVYLCYGMYYLFNVVTEKQPKAGAVLIRAIEPVYGIEKMIFSVKSKRTEITNGPGKICRALDIRKCDNGKDITSDKSDINIMDGGIKIKKEAVSSGPRVGIKKAIDLPLRFFIKENKFVSKTTN